MYGAVLSGGFVAGVILGGLLTGLLSWRWVMFVNVPVAAAAALAAPLLLPESRDSTPARRLDLPGAATITAAILALVYGVSEANDAGWLSLQTIALILVGFLLAGLFVWVEARSPMPLAPLGILRRRTVLGANAAGVMTFAAAVGVTFTLTLYMQQVLRYTPIETGLAFGVLGLTAIVAGTVAPRVARRLGARLVLVTGLVFQGLGTLLLVAISVEPSSLGVLLLGTGLVGFGHVAAIVAFTVIATSGLPDGDQGLAGGIANTSQQVGAALGVAIFAAVASAQSGALRAAGPSTDAEALVGGFRYALLAGAILAGSAVLVAVLVLRKDSREPPVSAAVDQSPTGSGPKR